MRTRNKQLILLLVLSIFLLLLFFSSSVSARVYYLEGECVVFVKSDRIVYFSIFDGKVIGGHIIETDMSKVIDIKQGVRRSYYNEETGVTQTEFQTQIVILDIAPGVKTKVIPFGDSKTGIGVYFTFSAEDSEKNL